MTRDRSRGRMASGRDWANRTATRAIRALRFAMRGAPVSVGAVVVLWSLALVTGSIVELPATVLHTVGVGIVPFERGRWWTPVTAGLWAPGLTGYVIAAAFIVAVCAPVERRIGSMRFAVAALTTQIIGSLAGVMVAGVAKIVDAMWEFRLHLGVAVGPTTWIVGVAMVATAQMEPLWRRRVRTGLLALLITLALFAGQLQDVIRLAAALTGWALGPVLLGRSSGDRITGTPREGRVLVALVVAATAMGPALAVLSPHAVGPLAVLRELFHGASYSPADVRDICAAATQDTDCNRAELELRLAGVGPTVMSLMPTLVLLVCSDGLRRGRRFAWLMCVVAQLLLLGFSLLNYAVRFLGPNTVDSLFYVLESPTAYRTVVPFLTPLAVLLVLIRTRRYFDVRAPRGTYRRMYAKLTGLIAAAGLGYVVVGYSVRRGFDRPTTVGLLLRDFPERLVPPVYLQWVGPAVLPDDAVATVLYEWTGVVVWSTACILLLQIFLVPAHHAGADAAERARILLRASGGTALSWMTTWRNNSFWFSPDGCGYVAYRAIGGIALTVGDPVGPRDRLRDYVVGFAEFAVAHGWTPCYYSVTGEVKHVTDELGWTSIHVAEETILDLRDLAFTGKRFQDVRTALNRARKQGIRAEWIRFPTAPQEFRSQIFAISRAWLADKDMPEMGFTLGGITEIDDDAVRCLIAVDEDGLVHGVTSWLPVYDEGRIISYTLDFMRRRAEGFASTMEFLIASAAQTLRAEGAEFVSLSGAPLAKVGRSTDPTARSTMAAALDRLLDGLGRTLEPVYGFRSLLAFKAKFQPSYEPMYMTFADHAALPSIGSAIARAYLPDMTFKQGIAMLRTLIER